jgi:thioredoxin 1
MAFTGRYADTEPSLAQVEAMGGTVALEFGTAWCPHCIAAQPPLQQALAGREDIAHVKVEDGRGRPLGRAFRVKLWPTVVLLRDGQEVARLIRPRAVDEVQRALALLDGAPSA